MTDSAPEAIKKKNEANPKWVSVTGYGQEGVLEPIQFIKPILFH